MLLLSPVKVEEIKKDPYFLMFHNFFTDREIDKIKDLAKPRVFILSQAVNSMHIKCE